MDQVPIPVIYRDGDAKLNCTIAALIGRSIAITLAASLKDRGFTLASLQQLADAALAGLSVLIHTIAQMRKDRPSIPPGTFYVTPIMVCSHLAPVFVDRVLRA